MDIFASSPANLESKLAQQKLSFLIQNNFLGVIEWNTAFEVVDWNPAAERIFGYSLQEVLGRSLAELIVPERALVQFKLIMQTLLLQYGEKHSINENVTKDGRSITCKWHNTSLTNTQGDVVGVLSLINDITDSQVAAASLQSKCQATEATSVRKRTEEALRISEQNLRTIFNSTYDAIFIHALDGTILDVNERMLEMYQVSRSTALQSSIQDSFSAPNNPFEQLPHYWRRVLAGERLRFEWKARRSFDQTIFDVEVTLRTINLNGEEVVLANVRDITERKIAEAALRQSEAELRKQATELKQALSELQRTPQLIQSGKMLALGQLVAGVAHEINNPVNFIYGNLIHAYNDIHDLLKLVQLYKETYPQPTPSIMDLTEAIDLNFLQQDLPRMLCSMQVGVERIIGIVSSLRTFSRLDEAAVKAIDIHLGLDSTLVILEHRLKAKPGRSDIQVIKEYNQLPIIECYAGQMNQVFMNIIANAIDAIDEVKVNGDETNNYQPIIVINTSVIDNNSVAIRITDNGPGIPEEIKQRIFDPFFTTKPVGKGTGLGMSISYQIVTQGHGGSLHCSSTGQGATFTIVIPIQTRLSNYKNT